MNFSPLIAGEIFAVLKFGKLDVDNDMYMTDIHRQVGRSVGRQMDGWMDGWMDGSMDRQIDRWIDRQIDRSGDRQIDNRQVDSTELL